jgi:hypothetical protein
LCFYLHGPTPGGQSPRTSAHQPARRSARSRVAASAGAALRVGPGDQKPTATRSAGQTDPCRVAAWRGSYARMASAGVVLGLMACVRTSIQAHGLHPSHATPPSPHKPAERLNELGNLAGNAVPRYDALNHPQLSGILFSGTRPVSETENR